MPSTTVWGKAEGPVLNRLDVMSKGDARTESHDSAGTLDVIIVPDAELRRGKPDQMASLLDLVERELPPANLYEYSMINRRHSLSIWHSLVESGDDLVDALTKTLDYKSGIRPLVYVAYGFGGIVVKRALHRLEAQALTNRMLRLAQQGIVFMGVPHPTNLHRERWPKLNRLLEMYGQTRQFTKEYLGSKMEFIPQIADVSSNFETTITNGTIVTVHEVLPTRRRLFSFQKTVVLGRELAEILLKNEKMVPTSTDYFGICKFGPKSRLYEEISTLLRGCASMKIASRSNPEDITVTFQNTMWSTQSNDDSANDVLTPSGSSYPPQTVAASGYSSSFEVIVAEKKAPKMPCHLRTTIDRNERFVGRSEIRSQIDNALLPDRSHAGGSGTPRSFSLCGFGGIGKTQIAKFYAFERENSFDAIFWVHADDSIKISKSFQDMAEALDLVEDGDRGNAVVIRDKVLQWLSEPRKQQSITTAATTTTTTTTTTTDAMGNPEFARWLMILDNADNISLVRDFWPPSAHYGSILVTSRNPFAKTDLASKGTDLPLMSNSECAMLLLKHVGETATPESERAAESLASKLGNVPLAITQISAQICEKDLNIEEYLTRHGDDVLLKELNRVPRLPPQEQYNFTLATVWGFENFGLHSLALIRVMVFMDPDAVSEFILEQETTKDISSSAGKAKYNYPQPGEEYVGARTELSKTSLITRNKDTKALAWHRQVRDVARDRMTVEELQSSYQLCIDLLHRAWEYIEDRFARENFKRKRRDEVLPHIPSIIEAYDSLFGQSSLPVQTARQLVELLQEVGWYLVQGSQYSPALPVFELAMSICHDHGHHLKDLLAYTAFSYARYGEETNMDPQEVFRYCLQFHELRKELNDGTMESREHVATSHTSLAQGYLLLDKYDDAVKHCQACIDLEAHFPDHAEEGAISQFAHIYQAWARQGMQDYEEAARLCSRVIDYREKKFGPDDQESIKLGLALHCLGNVREKQGLMTQSFKAHERSLANFRAILGPDSFRVAQLNLKLGEHYGRQEGWAQFASVHFDQAIETFERTPYYKPELARALYKRSRFLASLKKATNETHNLEGPSYSRAVKLYRELRPQAPKMGSPGDEEFDSIVRFWSR